MTDTLQQRAEKFREQFGGWLIPARGNSVPRFANALIEEIRWMRAQYSVGYGSGLEFESGLQSFADHLLACLGEK